MKSRFSAILSRFVSDYVERTGERKGQIADRANITAVRLSHLLSGERNPRSRDEVVSISKAIDLTIGETNALLQAAEFAPLSALEQTRGPEATEQIERAIRERTESLLLPDREALAEMMARDSQLLIAAWDSYLTIREDLYQRRWQAVAQEVERVLPNRYWHLRQMASRYYAYVQLLRAAAELHRGDLEQALGAAIAARDAAEIAADPMLLCRTAVRLGDIAKASGRLTRAEAHYGEAQSFLDQWTNSDPGQSDHDVWLSPYAPKSKRWIANWHARILRKQGTLSMAKGQPYEALAPLEKSAQLFHELHNRYEESRAYFGLGWAKSVIGKWDEAFTLHKAGLEITNELNNHREWTDLMQLVEGYLCIASDFLYRKEFDSAREYLDRANELFKDEDLKDYHERGRLHLLYGRLYRGIGRPEGVAMAKEQFLTGIEFHLAEKIRNPVRLASLYNALGTLELADRNWLAANTAFDNALQWIGEADPPNSYYRAMILINCVDAQLRMEEMPDQLKSVQRTIDEARNLAEQGKHWRQLAMIEAITAEYQGRMRSIPDAIHHAALAVLYACKFNRWVADETYERIRVWMQRLIKDEAVDIRERLIIEIASEAPSILKLDTDEERELQRILDLMSEHFRRPVYDRGVM